jgi:hypothetical protein
MVTGRCLWPLLAPSIRFAKVGFPRYVGGLESPKTDGLEYVERNGGSSELSRVERSAVPCKGGRGELTMKTSARFTPADPVVF